MMSAKIYYPSYKPESITIRSKRFTQVAGFFSLTIFSIVLLVFLIYPSQSQIIPAHEKYVVQANDTLWSIANANYPNTADLRNAVYAIEEADGIKDAGALPVGQAIDLPVIQQ